MADISDKDIDKLLSSMLEQLEDMNPGIVDKMVKDFDRRKKGQSVWVLDELRDFSGYDGISVSRAYLDYNLPNYVDFWDYHDDRYPTFDYKELMEGCEKKRKKKKQLTADINDFLESVHAFYDNDYTIVSHQLVMVAAAISKYELDGCHKSFLNLLRGADDIIADLFMDDEHSSINMYAELCHPHLDELFEIATDGAVNPYARGVAIGAIAKSSMYSPKDLLKITGMLRSVIETYVGRAKSDRKVSVAIIRVTSLIAARIHAVSLLPYIQEVYRKLRISSKGPGALSVVERIMGNEEECLTSKERILEYVDDMLEFMERFHNPLLDEDEDEDWEDEEDWEDYEDIDDDDYDNDDGFPDFRKVKFVKPEFDITSYRPLHIINGKVRIVGEDLANAHPKGIAKDTDAEYVSFANGIVNRIIGECDDLSNYDIHTIALKCTLYFEDVIADAGIWRSFVETMRKMYGKPLPFHNVDDATYYMDEPNLEDVKLLVWLSRLDSHSSGIANPENVALMNVAKVIYDYMNEMFEKMPINESLADYFHKAAFMSDFYEARDAVKWVYISSYLTSTAVALKHLIEVMDSLQQFYDEESFYEAESTVVFDTRIGPLALFAKEWLAMILESNGKKKEAEAIRGMEGKFAMYHVIERSDNLFGNYTIKRSDGLVIELDKQNFTDIVGTETEADYFMGSLVSYNGQWYLNGVSSLSNKLKSLYESEKKEAEEKAKASVLGQNNDKLIKKNGGSRLFYFKNSEDVRKFVTKTVGLKLDVFNNSMLYEKKSNWVAFMPDGVSGMIYLPEVATLVADPKNPFFNEKKAREDHLALPLTTPYAFVSYLMKNNLLPYASFVCSWDENRGVSLFQENYDFVIRCLGENKIMPPNDLIS